MMLSQNFQPALFPLVSNQDQMTLPIEAAPFEVLPGARADDPEAGECDDAPSFDVPGQMSLAMPGQQLDLGIASLHG